MDLLDVEGCIITIDAMGTQRKIAAKIIEKKADYLLALKGNQGTLKEDVEDLFRIQKPEDKSNTLEKNRGRIESRTCEVIRNLDQLENREKWVGLKSIIKISSIVEVGEKKINRNSFIY